MGEGKGEETEAALNIVHVDVFGYLNFVLYDQLKSQAPPGAVIGESTLTRKLGIRKEQKRDPHLELLGLTLFLQLE